MVGRTIPVLAWQLGKPFHRAVLSSIHSWPKGNRLKAGLWCLLLCLPGLGQIPPAYYAGTEGLYGQELRARLHAIIRDHTVIPYSSSSRPDTADALAQLDAVPGDTNRVRVIYSHATLPTASFGLSDGWNREHVWPNSYGIDDWEPAYSDLHNLKACDANVNSARGNKWFDVSNPAEGGIQCPGHAEAPDTCEDSNSWEPPADQRGDVARALFYMDVRYVDPVKDKVLRLVDDVGPIGSSTNLMGRLSTLLHWHTADPPDEAERQRNDVIDRQWQHNRNPFIDHPDFAERIHLPRLLIMRHAENGEPYLLATATDLRVVMEHAPTVNGPWLELGSDELSAIGPSTLGTPQFFRLRLP